LKQVFPKQGGMLHRLRGNELPDEGHNTITVGISGSWIDAGLNAGLTLDWIEAGLND